MTIDIQSEFRMHQIKNIAASPKKTKNPITSVTVVNKTVDEIAGSLPSRFKKIGIPAPNNPATIKLIAVDEICMYRWSPS